MSAITRHPRPLAVVLATLAALGALAAAFTLIWPSPARALFPHQPHPTLAGTPREALDILAANLAVLAVPLLFAGAAAGRPGPWRLAGDLATAAIIVLNAGAVGAALALHGLRLLPYLPHLPAEAAALTLACATWVTQRSRAGQLLSPAIGVVVLAVCAALAETFATPGLSR